LYFNQKSGKLGLRTSHHFESRLTLDHLWSFQRSRLWPRHQGSYKAIMLPACFTHTLARRSFLVARRSAGPISSRHFATLLSEEKRAEALSNLTSHGGPFVWENVSVCLLNQTCVFMKYSLRKK